jgi:hypothetical protein
VGIVTPKAAEGFKKQAAGMTRQMRAQIDWSPSELPDWLDRDCYLSKVYPLVAKRSPKAVAAAIDVSLRHAQTIVAGQRVPHPRHWLGLVGLVGVGEPLAVQQGSGLEFGV